MPASPCFASVTIISAAPARLRPCWRWQNCCANSARRRSCSVEAMADDCDAAKTVAADIAARGKPVLSAHLKPEDASVTALRGKRVLAFAGIGDPGRFFRTLRAGGIDVVRERAFPDHHPFSKSEIENLTAEAKRDALTLVTTEKDLARLRGSEGAEGIVPFPVTLEFDDAAGLRTFLRERLFKARGKKFRTSN